MERGPSTILVVDDDELVRERYREWLDAPKFDVVATGVPDEVLATAKRASVAVVAGEVAGRTQDQLLRTLDRTAPGCAVVTVDGDERADPPFDERLCSPVDRRELLATVDRLADRAAYVDRLDALLAAARRAAGGDGRARRLRAETRRLQQSFEATDFEAAFRLVGPVANVCNDRRADTANGSVSNRRS